MKTTFLSILLLVIICMPTKLLAQERCIKKNDAVITIGYGAPSIIRAFLKYKTTRDQIRVSGAGPFIFKSELMLTNRIGVTLNATLSQSGIAWDDNGYDTINQKYREFEFGIRAVEFSGLVRGNYHFIRTSKFDAYGGLGFGYGFINMRAYTLAHTTTFSFKYALPNPLSLEATAGIRYFPLKNLGVYSEVGIGKSWILFEKYFIPEALIQSGIVFKF
jgi:hypothetical protein